jgi:hypothetical protein
MLRECKHRGMILMIALKMKAASTSETSVNFYQTTRRNNPEDSHLNIVTAGFCRSLENKFLKNR